MKVGIDLTWVKVGKSGGIESYVRNLLKGFDCYCEDEINFVLFLANDNYDSFVQYKNDKKFTLVNCTVTSTKVAKRIIWSNIHLNKYAKKYKVDLMFVPIYNKPLLNNKVKYIITIHDLQALHYPEYFSRFKYLWLILSWRINAATADSIVSITDYVKSDIIKNFNTNPSKITTIYNPIYINGTCAFEEVEKKYNIKKNLFFYTVSSKLKHKNLITLLKVMNKLKTHQAYKDHKLIISGVGGDALDSIKNFINSNELNDTIVLTGFVSNEERNCLYKNCALFLFPSIFEGFGMPIIEALTFNTKVLATNIPAITEITENKLTYVNSPYDVDEWIEKITMILTLNSNENGINIDKYSLHNIVNKYVRLFKELKGKH